MKVSISQRRIRDLQCWVLDWVGLDGKRERRFFSSNRAAESEASNANLQRRQTGDVWCALTADQRNEALSVIAEVQHRGVSLRRVWDEWQAGVAAAAVEAPTLASAIQKCVEAKRTAGRRPKYVKDLSSLLRRLARRREATTIATITTAAVESWVSGKYKAAWGRATAL